MSEVRILRSEVICSVFFFLLVTSNTKLCLLELLVMFHMFMCWLNVTFVLITTPKTWTEAQSYCREHHTDLASVRNMTENQKVMDLVPAGQKAWIGLFRDSWKWSDGSNSSFRYWAEGQPNNYGGNQDCVVAGLGIDGKWWDDPCGQTRPILCYSLREC
uniref:C-type lectin domain-containing protein n=1 Tax=Sparus aurata TaxID=8175 RepID=A0A671YPN6_SPAAU